ncbi:single-stranded-DNA-specific exonuclease RecJ [Alkalilimnicola ehrlichii]|uniref:single-stranded-DNA-specific exonuclease RecJ n=1 Tax=Alkalilimnicola ehrlichii TaxID=351052 RepID=UPI002162A1F3|nr:single-stranded-DNA-specific exonuclease RecJ [Alkalilimnicola ehrlichii]
MGIEDAVCLLEDALWSQARILIVGDFDADGATSCAVAIRALRALGAQHVDYLVPNRFTYGYGLTPEIVDLAAEKEPDLLITVDNGISSIEGVRAARALGIAVLVTDHHLPGAELPAADAIVNPNLPDCDFPSKNLAGVGVIFYIMLALRKRLRATQWFSETGLAEPNMANLLDLVGLGTVADVVVLDANNRIFVDQALRRIRAGKTVPGVRALLEVAGRDYRRIVAADLGFAVGPRLNAAGRLEDMSLGIECLLTDDPGQAREYAERLDDLNRQRREIESQMQEEALADLNRLRLQWDAKQVPAGICLMDEGWHQGVIGILASRIKERFHRPVVAFAPAGDGSLKGSARSISGLHMRDLLDLMATRHPGLIERFGGHAMAAGLSIPEHNYGQFEQVFADTVDEVVEPELLEEVLLSDGSLAPQEFQLEVADTLRDGGPWGQGFPEPRFDGRFEIGESRIVGEKHLKFSLRPPGGREWLDGIAFNAVERGWGSLQGEVTALYRLDVNEFRGRRSVQLMLEHLEP